MGKGARLFAAWLALGSVVPSLAQEAATAPELRLDQVSGSVMKLEGSHLLIGLNDGGVASFDPVTKKPRFHIRGDGSAPVKDVVLFGNKVWWTVEGSPVLRHALQNGSPFEIDVRQSGLRGPIKRLGLWQQMIVVHGPDGCRFVDPMSQRVLTPHEALPASVAAIVNQSVVTTHWKDGKGLLVAVRRFGEKKNPKPGEVADLGILTAWSAEWRGDYRLLGSYTADLVDFREPVALSHERSGPSADEAATVSYGEIGNIKVGPEGIVALDSDEALTIPFYKDNWVTERVKTAVPPKYPQSTAYHQSDVWWAEQGRLLHASLEDGSTEVYAARIKGEILSVAADEDGAWVLSSEGVRRLQPDDPTAGSGFIRYEIGPDSERPGIGGQARLAWVLKSAQKPGAKKLLAKTPLYFIKEALKSAGVPPKKALSALKGGGSQVAELQYGDVILDKSGSGFYVGNGKMLAIREGGLLTRPLTLTPEARIHRFFTSAPKIPMGVHTLPIREIGPVFPIGVAKPNPRLGHGLFVRVNPGAPHDQPYLPSHHRLLSIAEDWVGTPYRWGGSSMDGTDCSGFVMSVFRELGIKLPRHSQWMARAPFGEVVFDELHFGDVLVFPHPKHVAIYIGDGRTVETTRGAVGYSTVYRRRVAYVRRFLFE